MQQPNKFTPIIISTVIMTVISLFPVLNLINLLCCAGIIIGAYAGTAFYAKRLSESGSFIRAKDGAAIGILSGILTALFVVGITTIISMLTSTNPIPEMYKIIDNFGYQLPPEAENMLRKISDEYSKHGFSITITLINLAADLIFYPLFGALGGIIAANVYIKKSKTV